MPTNVESSSQHDCGVCVRSFGCPCGVVQAITYSNMQVRPGEDRSDIYVIVDI